MSEGRVQRRKMIKDLKHEEWLRNLDSCPGEEQTKGRQIASFEFHVKKTPPREALGPVPGGSQLTQEANSEPSSPSGGHSDRSGVFIFTQREGEHLSGMLGKVFPHLERKWTR